MKTSFYFVFWITIYPILGLLNIDFVNRHAFAIALLCVIGINLLIKRLMPNVLKYNAFASTAPIYEDIYTGNVASFKKRFRRDMLLELAGALYFAVMICVIIFGVPNGGMNELVSLIIFAIISVSAFIRCADFISGFFKLKSNPTGDECEVAAMKAYKLDYAAYYEQRKEMTYAEIFPPRPTSYKAFIILSIILAVLSTIFGIFFCWSAIEWIIIGTTMLRGVLAIASILLLYGSLALYYGIKDLISCINAI